MIEGPTPLADQFKLDHPDLAERLDRYPLPEAVIQNHPEVVANLLSTPLIITPEWTQGIDLEVVNQIELLKTPLEALEDGALTSTKNKYLEQKCKYLWEMGLLVPEKWNVDQEARVFYRSQINTAVIIASYVFAWHKLNRQLEDGTITQEAYNYYILHYNAVIFRKRIDADIGYRVPLADLGIEVDNPDTTIEHERRGEGEQPNATAMVGVSEMRYILDLFKQRFGKPFQDLEESA